MTAPQLGGTDPADLRIDHDVSVDLRSGRVSVRVPLDLTGGRHGFGPALALTYGSSAATSPYGLGWSLDGLPTIEVSTRRGLPTYDSRDVYAFSLAGDLVPALVETATGWVPRTSDPPGYHVRYWRPRRDHGRVRVEQWIDRVSGDVHWRSRDVADVLTIYGRDPLARVVDPADPTRVFAWLPQAQYDPCGNAILFVHEPETHDGVDLGASYEQTRGAALAQRYLKRIRYGNSRPVTPDAPIPADNRWQLEVVFDYGDHVTDRPAPDRTWPARPDPRSSYRAGFEVRTHRLLRRVLKFHHFAALGTDPVLVGAYRLEHHEDPGGSTLTELHYTGFRTGQSRSLPPLVFTYSTPSVDATFAAAPAETLAQAPAGLRGGFRWLDLFGEGLPGLLTETDTAWYYAANEGGGRFAPRQLVADRPSYRLGEVALADVVADGNPKLAVLHGRGSGYYAYDRDSQAWQGFRPFDALPHLEAAGGRAQWLDVNGDGRNELVIADAERLTWYSALGAAGFGDPVTVAAPASGRAGTQPAPGAEGLDFHFADMTGDGLADQVRIGNGRVEYWPHLGHGRFGPPVLMQGAPVFAADGEFDRGRLVVADVDGDGVADLIYLGTDGARWWRNQGGNSLVPGGGLAETGTVDSLSTVQVLDFLGDGTPCLVWSSPVPSAGTSLRYARLTGGARPHVLLSVNNSAGAEHRLGYASSAAHYLGDRAAGRPWSTRLPGHSWVVEHHEIADLVGGTSATMRYAYHDGCYDAVERSAVFGAVDSYDGEGGCTRTWFHTGAVQLSLVDVYAADAAAVRLVPHSVAAPASLRAGDYERAVAALAGNPVREELYPVGVDGRRSAHPLHVTQYAYEVRRLQPGRSATPGTPEWEPAVQAYEVEQLTAVYEGAGGDPRVTHDLVLTLDGYGLPALSATAAYPRRGAPAAPAQGRLRLTLTAERRAYVDTEGQYLLAVPVEQREYELAGCTPGPSGVFDRVALRAAATTAVAAAVPVHAALPTRGPAARLLTWEQTYYWDSGRTAALGLGTLGARALPHHTEQACFTQQLVDGWYGDVPGAPFSAALLTAGRYVQRDGYWWRPGETAVHAGTAGFYLPTGATRPDGTGSTVGYDASWLVPVSVTDAVGNTTVAELDYHLLEASKVTDPNGAVAEVRFDPLGVAVVMTGYGRVRTGTGTTAYGQSPLSAYQPMPLSTVDAALADPAGHVQAASAVLRYELGWAPGGAPPRVARLVREDLAFTDTASGSTSRIMVEVTHLDGFGRSLQTKTLVGPGEAVLRPADGALVLAPDGTPRQGPVATRWRASGHVQYNGRQEPVREYEPFYSSTVDYEADDELATFGAATVRTYDAAGREVRHDLPNGTHTKVVYGAWEIAHHDQNDTVLDSGYRLLREHLPIGDPERDAYDKAVAHANTPERQLLDPAGDTVARIVVAPAGGAEQRTSVERDALGREVTVVDARGVLAFAYDRDMADRVLRVRTADAGRGWNLPDAYDRPAHAWDARGVHVRRSFDAADRPIAVDVDGGLGLSHRTEELVYGDDPTVPDGTARNARGRPILHRDQAGTVEYLDYTPDGEPLRTRRLLRVDYQDEPDWAGAVPMRTEPFLSEYGYDALGRIVRQRLPDNTTRRCEYLAGGGLARVLVSTSDGRLTDLAVLDGAELTASGERSRANLGNGVELTRAFDPETGATSRITARLGTKALQDITYTYDPVGNIVRREDLAQRPNGPVIAGLTVTAESSYTYGAAYQLVKATGRVHQALLEGDHRPRVAGTLRGTRHLSFNNGAAVERYERTYHYDLSGNLVWVRHAGTSRTWKTDMWVAPGSNRSVPALDPAGNPVSQPETHFDPTGNLTVLYHLRKLDWNYRGGLARAVIVDRTGTGDPDDAEYYVYDSTGTRVRKVFHRLVNGALEVTEKIYLDGCEIKRIRNDGELTLDRTTSHIADENGRLALVHSWTVDSTGRETDDTAFVRVRYGLTDHLGSAQLDLDEAGRVIGYEEYFPFGGTAFVAGDVVREVAARDYRFCGKEADEATGLYYVGQRYYAAWLGRWLSPDPSGPEDDENVYRYCGNDPVNHTDPDGLAGVTTRQGSVYQTNVDRPPADRSYTGITLEQLRLVEQGKGKIGWRFGKPAPEYIPNEKLSEWIASETKVGNDVEVLRYSAPRQAKRPAVKPPPPKKPPTQPPPSATSTAEPPAGDTGIVSNEAVDGGAGKLKDDEPTVDAGTGPNAANPTANPEGGRRDGTDGGTATAGSQRSTQPGAGPGTGTGAGGAGAGTTGDPGTGGRGTGTPPVPDATRAGAGEAELGQGAGTDEELAGIDGGVPGGMDGGAGEGDMAGTPAGSLGGRVDGDDAPSGPELPPGAIAPPGQTTNAGTGGGPGTGTGTGTGGRDVQRRAGGQGSGGGTGTGRQGLGSDASGTEGRPGAEPHDGMDAAAKAAGLANLSTPDEDGEHGGVPGGMGIVKGHGAQALYIALTVVTLIVAAAKLFTRGVTGVFRQIARLFTKRFWTDAAKKVGAALTRKALKKTFKKLTNWKRWGLKVKRFFVDTRSYESIRKAYWKARGGANGRTLHHWFFPQRGLKIFKWTFKPPDRFVNAGWNLIECNGWLNSFMGREYPRQLFMRGVTVVVEWLVRIGIISSVPGSFYGGYVAGKDVAAPGAPPDPRAPVPQTR